MTARSRTLTNRLPDPSLLRTIVRHMDSEQCIAWFGNVQLIFSHKPPSSGFMRKIVDELRQLSLQSGLDTGALLVIRSDVEPPDEEARNYIRAELARSSMRAAAQVVEGTGFRGAAMRSVLTMLQLVTRPPYPMKVFDNIAPASSWLSEELRRSAGEAPAGADLTREALKLRARFTQGTAEAPSSP